MSRSKKDHLAAPEIAAIKWAIKWAFVLMHCLSRPHAQVLAKVFLPIALLRKNIFVMHYIFVYTTVV
jgi:hypothetical protein